MNDFLLHAHVIVKTSNLVISCRCYAVPPKIRAKIRAARAARIFVYFLLTNDIIVLWRSRLLPSPSAFLNYISSLLILNHGCAGQ